MTNVTVDDHSPLIRYEPPDIWFSGNGSSDPDNAVEGYYQQTFMACRTQDCSASFQFQGIAVYLFGGKRANHGLYQVTLDGATLEFNGSSVPEFYHSLLFSAENLSSGSHNLTVTNAQDILYLDVDQITWTTVSDINPASQHRILHTDPLLRYEPSSAWEQINRSRSFDGTVHSTSSVNASVSLNFTGNFIDIFGQVDSDAGVYTVLLDDREPQTFNATWDQFAPQTHLYYLDGLDPGLHTLKLVNTPSRSGERVYLEYILVSSDGLLSIDGEPASSFIPSPSTLSPPSTSGTRAAETFSAPLGTDTTKFRSGEPDSNNISTAAVAGISVAAVFLVAILTIMGFLQWKRSSIKRIQRVLPQDTIQSSFHTPYISMGRSSIHEVDGNYLENGARRHHPLAEKV